MRINYTHIISEFDLGSISPRLKITGNSLAFLQPYQLWLIREISNFRKVLSFDKETYDMFKRHNLRFGIENQ
jgi:hypothetical protein